VNLSELRTALQERREDYSQSDAKLDRKINQSYQVICSRRRWGWLRRRHTYTTYESLNSEAGIGFFVLGTENGKRTITVSGVETPTSLGKLVRIDNDFYRVASINAAHTQWTLDRPLRCTVTIGTPPATATHYIKVIYNETALPVGTLSVIESVLFKGGSSSYGTPLSMGAIGPEDMVYREMDVGGRPSSFATVRKEPIPAPRMAPTLATSSGAELTLGEYTYWYTYVDKQTGAESALGPPSTVSLTAVGMQQVTVGTPTADEARTDLLIRLYRSTVDGGAPYLIADDQGVRFAGYADSTTDEYLSITGPTSASTLFMQIYPIPDAEYEIHSLVQIEPVPLSGDNDYPLFDSQFHNVILDGAEAMMLEASDEQGRANQARQRYELGIARMIQMDRMNQQRTVVFGGTRGARGKPTWQYSSGTSEADFKA
jgi:hypothetical protein